jgi:hypothetical protein
MATKTSAERKFLIGLVLKTDEPMDYDLDTNTPTYWDDESVKGELMSWLTDLGFKVTITIEEV